jgi:hypothetical protein
MKYIGRLLDLIKQSGSSICDGDGSDRSLPLLKI